MAQQVSVLATWLSVVASVIGILVRQISQNTAVETDDFAYPARATTCYRRPADEPARRATSNST